MYNFSIAQYIKFLGIFIKYVEFKKKFDEKQQIHAWQSF